MAENRSAAVATMHQDDPKFVESQVIALLQRQGYPALQSVECQFHEGMLVLRGRVPSYYLKQLAQEVAARVVGVEQIDNRLIVESPSTFPARDGHHLLDTNSPLSSRHANRPTGVAR